MNRPSEYSCRSQPTLATVIGLRANATAMLVPSSMVVGVLGGQQQRQERIVVDLGGPAAVVAPPLAAVLAASATSPSWLETAAVDLQAAAGRPYTWTLQ